MHTPYQIHRNVSGYYFFKGINQRVKQFFYTIIHRKGNGCYE